MLYATSTTCCNCIIKFNFTTGRTAHAARTLLNHESDILEVWEKNKMNFGNGKEAKLKLEKAKKLTSMLNFKSFGCKIGEDSLKAHLKMAEKKSQEEARVLKKRMITK